MAMFVFSRRELQRALWQLEHVLSTEQRNALANRLNRVGRDRLAAMWELIFLQALSSAVEIQHEVPLANDRRPDFSFIININDRQTNVIGDIACVSDAGLDENNPVGKFSDAISRLARKHGLNPAHFHGEFGARRHGSPAKRRVNLLLPTGKEFATLLTSVVEPYLEKLAASKPTKDELKYVAEDVELTVKYDQSKSSFGFGYPTYDLPISLTENPVFKRLRAKSDQLRAAPDNTIRLVILCDGDCASMRYSPFPGTYSSRQIGTDFLRQNSSIDLVLLVSVEQSNKFNMCLAGYRLKCDLVAAPISSRSFRASQSAIASIQKVLETAINGIPRPVTDPANAAIRCNQPGYGLGKHGGYQMGIDYIRISRRLLHELLAGKVTGAEFARLHGWSERQEENRFLFMLQRGFLIESTKIIVSNDDDDDWVEFRFSPRDPAITPFTGMPPADDTQLPRGGSRG